MKHLKEHLHKLVDSLDDSEIIFDELSQLTNVYPFNEYEYMISILLDRNKISLENYYQLRKEYIERNSFLYIFEYSPKIFGDKWVGKHLEELVPELKKPSKKIDQNYSGQYDFLLNDIKIEVKASRAVDSNSKEALHIKALTSDSKSSFVMNFQQIKPDCCDVFLWIAVWRDKIRYWVLHTNEVKTNKYYSVGQHRGNTGEGQLHLKDSNIEEFSQYEFVDGNLYDSIMQAYKRY